MKFLAFIPGCGGTHAETATDDAASETTGLAIGGTGGRKSRENRRNNEKREDELFHDEQRIVIT